MHRINTCVMKVSKKAMWLSHAALSTIYKGAILPLLYGAPVWIEALEKECNKAIYSRVQRLINIKSFSNYIQRSSLHLDWFITHSDKGGGSGQFIHHERKSSLPKRPRSTAKKPGSTQQTQLESLNNKTSMLYKYSQTAARVKTG